MKTAIDYGIVGLLIVLSAIALGIALERWLYFARVRLQDFGDRRELELALLRKLHLIATIASNAPYLGLLGTVLGIMLTFTTLGQNGLTDSGAIMAGLALALKATAVGLAVAIPSVTAYNLLLRRAKDLLLRWDVSHGRAGV